MRLPHPDDARRKLEAHLAELVLRGLGTGYLAMKIRARLAELEEAEKREGEKQR